MIVGIGCDVVDHKSAKLMKWETDIGFLKRVLSSAEIRLFDSYTRKKIRFVSGRFAGKEAVLKCLGIGMQDGISLTDIKIVQSSKGKPVVKLSGEVKRIANVLKISTWHISITHSSTSSIAFAIAENSR